LIVPRRLRLAMEQKTEVQIERGGFRFRFL